MEKIKISAMPAATSLTGDELVPVVQSGVNKKATVTLIGAGKVDKVTGKGLSTEDYSTADKNKLGGIEAGADVTDEGNVGTVIGGATAITSIADADKVAVTVSSVLKTLSWAYVKSILKTYLDGLYEVLTNKSTNVITDGSSDTKYPSVKAIKDYADGLVVGLLDDRGNYDASVNTFPAAGGSGTAGAILKGDLWYISVAGTLGGVAVSVGSSLRALIDTPGQTAGNWNILGCTVENEATDTTCFLLFATDATGRLSPKSNAGLIFNSNTGLVTVVQLSSGKITMSDIGVYGLRMLTNIAGVGAGLTVRDMASQSIIQFGNNLYSGYTGPIDQSKAGVMIRLDTRNGTGSITYGGNSYTLFQIQTRAAGAVDGAHTIPFQLQAAPTGSFIMDVNGLVTLNHGVSVPIAIISTLATGTAPFTIASTTVVPNLNVSFLEGHAASYFQIAHPWSAVTVDGNLAVDTGTLANKGTLLTLTLPTTAAVGKVISVAGMNAGLWRIAQNANQIIHFGSINTTTGASGYLESTLAYDTVELICVVANLEFVVKGSIGNITIN